MPRQGLLFGPADDEPAVRPAAPSEAQRALARRAPAGLRVGTCSWSFPGWRGIVYADAEPQRALARHGLAAYASHPLLRTVCVDRAFYAPVTADELRAYADDTPADFRFLVKMAAECLSPHQRAAGGGRGEPNALYLDAGFATDMVVAPYVEGLGARAGALVLQLPPQGASTTRQPGLFAEALGAFLGALPRGPRYAVELRDAALLTADYAAALVASGAQHCLSVHPSMPSLDEQSAVVGAQPGAPLVARWMLGHGLRYDDAVARYKPFNRRVAPDEGARAGLARLCSEALAAGREAYVVVNNKAEGCAPESAWALAEAVAAGITRPPPR